MNILTIANHKGGTAKTTTAVTLAACLAEQRYRVTLLDLDPQGQASSWLGVRAENGHDMAAVLAGDVTIPHVVKPSTVNGVTVIAGGSGLQGLERTLTSEPGAELRLRRVLNRHALPADWLIVDCRPGVGLLTLNALAAARWLLIPADPSPLAYAALTEFLGAVQLVRQRLNRSLKLAGILPVRVRRHTRLARETLALMRRQFGGDVLPMSVPEASRVAEAPSHGKPLTKYARSHDATAAYRRLARLLTRRRA